MTSGSRSKLQRKNAEIFGYRSALDSVGVNPAEIEAFAAAHPGQPVIIPGRVMTQEEIATQANRKLAMNDRRWEAVTTLNARWTYLLRALDRKGQAVAIAATYASDTALLDMLSGDHTGNYAEQIMGVWIKMAEIMKSVDPSGEAETIMSGLGRDVFVLTDAILDALAHAEKPSRAENVEALRKVVRDTWQGEAMQEKFRRADERVRDHQKPGPKFITAWKLEIAEEWIPLREQFPKGYGDKGTPASDIIMMLLRQRWNKVTISKRFGRAWTDTDERQAESLKTALDGGESSAKAYENDLMRRYRKYQKWLAQA